MLNMTKKSQKTTLIAVSFVFLSMKLKGQGHVNVNKPVISRIYIVVHTGPLCPV